MNICNTRCAKIFIRCVVFCGIAACIPGYSQIGWFTVYTQGSLEYHGIHFPADGQVGYALGGYGDIVKTTNNGVTWSSQTSGITTLLEKIHFPNNDQTGYAIGSFGSVLKTVDGGNTWFSLFPGTSDHLYGLHFPVDEMTGYIVGEDGFIAKTTDGGLIWQEQSSGTSRRLTSVYFPVDALIGYVVGEGDSILKTTDGGVTWFEQTTTAPYGFEDIHFPEDVFTGYAVGYGCYIYKTTNGGDSWVEINNLCTSENRYAAWHTVYFVDNETGYIGGTGFDILKTTDGGVFFEEQGCPLGIVFDIQFLLDADTGFAVGSSGIIKTIFGGGNVIEETGGLSLIESFDVAPNPFVLYTRILHNEDSDFIIWDITGRKMGVYNSACIGYDLAPGVYYLQKEGSSGKQIQIVKIR